MKRFKKTKILIISLIFASPGFCGVINCLTNKKGNKVTIVFDDGPVMRSGSLKIDGSKEVKGEIKLISNSSIGPGCLEGGKTPYKDHLLCLDGTHGVAGGKKLVGQALKIFKDGRGWFEDKSRKINKEFHSCR